MSALNNTDDRGDCDDPVELTEVPDWFVSRWLDQRLASLFLADIHPTDQTLKDAFNEAYDDDLLARAQGLVNSPEQQKFDSILRQCVRHEAQKAWEDLREDYYAARSDADIFLPD